MAEATSQRPRVAIIGGGIAGLASAHALLQARSDLHVTIYESTDAVGGKLRVGEVGGVAVDLGAESMLARRPEGVDLARFVGLELVHPVSTTAGVWTRGAVRPLPRTLMGVPGDLDEAVQSGILLQADADRAALEDSMAPIDLVDDVSVGSLVAERVGGEVRDRLVEPLLGGVYAGCADELSVLAAVPQLAAAIRADRSLLRAAASVDRSDDSPVFAGIVGGIGRLAPAVAADVIRRGGALEAGATVRELRRTPTGWRLTIGPTRDERYADADAVVVAVPAAPAARLLRDVAPSAAVQLASIEYASMALVTFALDASNHPDSLAGSGFLVPPVDGRTIKASTFSSRKWGWLDGPTAMLRCSIGRHREESLLQRPDDELIAAAMRELGEAVGLRGPFLEATVTRWGGALPQYAVGHLDRVAAVRAAVAQQPGLAVCGAAYDGVGIPAVIASAQAAATRISGALGQPATMGQ